MPDLVDGLLIRKRLGRSDWRPPVPWGPDGFTYRSRRAGAGHVIVTGWYVGNTGWLHASISRPEMPTYDDLVMLHRAVWDAAGYAYQVFAPADRHVNIHSAALHLWGRADGANVLPDFAPFGTI